MTTAHCANCLSLLSSTVRTCQECPSCHACMYITHWAKSASSRCAIPHEQCDKMMITHIHARMRIWRHTYTQQTLIEKDTASSILLFKSSPKEKKRLEQKLDFENYIFQDDLQADCLTNKLLVSFLFLLRMTHWTGLVYST